MADAVASQTIQDGPRKAIFKFTNVSDGTGESAVKKIDVSALTADPMTGAACTKVTIEKIWYSTIGMGVKIFFDASTDDHAISLHGSGEYGYHGKQPNITNPESSGVTGDIVITNSSAVTGTFIIEVKKTKGYDNSGQTR